MPKPNTTERSSAAHPSIPQSTSAPAPGYTDVHGPISEDVPDELAFERAVSAEAQRRTAEAFPHALAGYIHEPIREAVRRELRRSER